MAKRANELQPNNASFQDTYAWVLFKMGNYEQALLWMERAIAGAEHKSATVMEHYGDILYFLNRKDDALANWKIAQSLGQGSDKLAQKIMEGKWFE